MTNFITYDKALKAVEDGKVVLFHYRGMTAEITPNCDLEYLRGELYAHLTLTFHDVVTGRYSTHPLHHLKIHPEYYAAVADGTKTFEIRKNDRNYQVGDYLLLKEYDPQKQKYTGKEIRKRITYITNFEQRDSFVVMAIQ